MEIREALINDKKAVAEATLPICLGQVGQRGLDALPSSNAKNWLCLIRKPLGNCSHHSPSSLGLCLYAAGESAHYPLPPPYSTGALLYRRLSKPAHRVEQPLSAGERQSESRSLGIGRWRTQSSAYFENSLETCPY